MNETTSPQTPTRDSVTSSDLLCGVFDNLRTMRRERWTDGVCTSWLPCDDAMKTNNHFPWGCFDDHPHNAPHEPTAPEKNYENKNE